MTQQFFTVTGIPQTLKQVETIPEGQTNNERFNALLNSCQNPRAVYNALAAFAVDGKEAAV